MIFLEEKNEKYFVRNADGVCISLFGERPSFAAEFSFHLAMPGMVWDDVLTVLADDSPLNYVVRMAEETFARLAITVRAFFRRKAARVKHWVRKCVRPGKTVATRLFSLRL